MQPTALARRLTPDGRSIARWAATLAVVAAAFAAPGPAALAGDRADKAAERQLVAAQRATLAGFKKSLSATARSFAADLVVLETDLSLGTATGTETADGLFDRLVVLQTTVSTSVRNAADGQARAAKDLLAELGGTPEGDYPAAFYPGDGTPTAAFEDAVDAVLAKTYAKLRKRVAATVKRVEAAGTHVNVRIEAPRRPVRVWDSTKFDNFVITAPTIDVVVAFSGAAAAGDGRMRLAGAASLLAGFADDVTAGAVFFGNSAEKKATPAGGRWATDLGDTPLVEGVWLVSVSQNSLIPVDTSIGLR